MWPNSKTGRVYARKLSGGGFVAIDVRAVGSSFRRTRYVGTLVVERRGLSRREGHSPPVVAEVSGANVDAVMRLLFPIAQSDWSIGAALLQLDPVGAAAISRVLPKSKLAVNG